LRQRCGRWRARGAWCPQLKRITLGSLPFEGTDVLSVRAYEETDHYRISADFFAHRAAMLKELLRDA
jgi:hypothetical protein